MEKKGDLLYATPAIKLFQIIDLRFQINGLDAFWELLFQLQLHSNDVLNF